MNTRYRRFWLGAFAIGCGALADCDCRGDRLAALDPCALVSCDTPAAGSRCLDSSTLVTGPGRCEEGECIYPVAACANGCYGDRCNGEDGVCVPTACAARPGPICASATTVTVACAPTCSATGQCEYPTANMDCLGGCVAGGCAPAGFEWRNPAPQGNSLLAIAGDAGRTLFGGTAGAFLVHDGTLRAQQSLPRGPSAVVADLLVRSSSEIWACGDGGYLARFDGTSWTQLPGPPEHLTGLWGDATSLFMVGASGPEGHLYRLEGDSFSTLAASVALWGVWGASATDVFAVGDNGTILHFDGSQAVAMTSPTSEALYGVHGRAADDVYAVGLNGTILHYDGVSWELQPSDSSRHLWAVWVPSVGEPLAVGNGGTVLRLTSGWWLADDTPVAGELAAVWGRSESDVFAAGEAGTIIHYDGTGWAPLTGSFTDLFLEDVWASCPNDVYVGGWGSREAIFHFDGMAWRGEEVEALNQNIVDIWGAGPNDVYAAGFDSVYRRGADGFWNKVASCGGVTGLWGSGPSDIFAVGTEIVHFDGTEWRTQLSVADPDYLASVWGTGPDDVWAVSHEGDVYRYDGNVWSRFWTTPLVEVLSGSGTVSVHSQLYRIWGSAADDVYIIGVPESFHYDGQGWSLLPEAGSAWSVTGTARDDVWLVGDSSALHFDGQGWTERMNLAVWQPFTGAFAFRGAGLWLVGPNGAVVQGY